MDPNSTHDNLAAATEVNTRRVEPPLSVAVSSLSAKAPVGQSLETNPGSPGDPGKPRFRALFSHLATKLRVGDRLTVLGREMNRAVNRDLAGRDQRVQLR